MITVAAFTICSVLLQSLEFAKESITPRYNLLPHACRPIFRPSAPLALEKNRPGDELPGLYIIASGSITVYVFGATEKLSLPRSQKQTELFEHTVHIIISEHCVSACYVIHKYI